MSFPDVTGRTLQRDEVRLPADLPAARTLVVCAFRREHQELVDRWITWAVDAGLTPASPLGHDGPMATAVIEVPVLGRAWRPARPFIDGGMAGAIRVPEVLARTVTLYTDVDAFCRATDITDPATVHPLVVTPAGEILARAAGEPDEAGCAAVAAALSTLS